MRPWLPAALALLAAATAARGGVTGSITLRGHAAQGGGRFGMPDERALDELLQINAAGFPMGEEAMLLNGSLNLIRSDTFGLRPYRSSGIGWSVSSGFLPLRGYPLTLFANGGASAGDAGSGICCGSTQQLLGFGGRLNLPALRARPAIRASYEQRESDVLLGGITVHEQRRTIGSGLSWFTGQDRIDVEARREELRSTAGDSIQHTLGATVGTPDRQTTLSGTDTRSTAPGADSRAEDGATLTHRQRWSDLVSTQHAASVVQTSYLGVTGRREEITSGATVRPMRARDFVLDADVQGSWQNLSGAPLQPGEQGNSRGMGAGLRGAYGILFGNDRLLLGTGAHWDRFAGNIEISGDRFALFSSLGYTLARVEKLRADLRYAITGVLAPDTRGGRRLENNAQLLATYQLTERTQLEAQGALTDQVQEVFVLSEGKAGVQKDRNWSALFRVTRALALGSARADVSYSRGRSFREGDLFLALLPVSREIVSAGAGLSLPLNYRATFDARVQASRTSLEAGPAIASVSGGASMVVRFGKINLRGDYTFEAGSLYGSSTFRHQIDVAFVRPFEVLR
ncbi:MAG TPA: hypothetical protein VFL36_18755 [Myxococcales bacterium]|nr:hypothetical protein [Myxococcales bacterium]